MIIGVLFVIVGILGFIPGATQHVDFKRGLRFSGTGSEALLFGLFLTSVMHNGILILTGAFGAVASFFTLSSRLFFAVFGVVYLFLAIFGFSIDKASTANFLPFNTADNIGHLVLAAVLLLFAVLLPTGETAGDH